METESTFDLNEAVLRWRGVLASSPAFRERDLDELEAHLRDSVAALTQCSLNREEAFLVAVRRLGGCDALQREFGVVHGRRVWLDRALWMLGGGMVLGDFSHMGNAIFTSAGMISGLWLNSAWALALCGFLAFGATVAGLGWVGGRLLLRGTRPPAAIRGWLRHRPWTVAVYAAVLSLLLFVLSNAMFLTGPVRLLPPETLGKYLMWRNTFSMIFPLILWPALLGFMLKKRARSFAPCD